MESIIKGNYPIQKDENLVIRNKLELVEYLEKEYGLTSEILSSIITLKKSFVNFMINQNQPVVASNFNALSILHFFSFKKKHEIFLILKINFLTKI